MTKLSKLFRDIESFYRKAIQDYSISKYSQWKTYVAPDTGEDEGSPDSPDGGSGDGDDIYGDLTRAAHEVSDPSLGSELLLIAEMYKKVVQLGRGYYSINRAISNIMNNYLEDEDSPEQSSVEDLLNEVVRDLRVRAGGQANLNKPDGPEVVAELKKFRDDFNNRAVQDEIDDLSQFDDKAVSTFDPTGGMGREESQKGSGRGYFVQKVKSLKDWLEYYSNEKNRYEHDFSQQNNKLLTTKKDNIIAVLSELIAKINEANKLQQDIAANPDPNKDAQLQALQQKIRELRARRSQIRGALRRDLLDLQKNNLQSELKDTKDNRKRFLLQQQLELNKTLLSQDRNKGEEVRLRKILLKSMSDGNSLGQETLQKLLSKIQEAAAQKKPIEEVRKQQAVNVREKKQAKNLEGLIIDLGQKIATQKIVVKQTITDFIRAEEHTVFQPYLNKIAEAKGSGNAEAIKASIKELQKAINSHADGQPAVIAYVESAKTFYDLKKLATIIEKSKVMDSKEPVPQDIAILINNMIQESGRLVSLYGKVKHFDTIVAATNAIVQLLQQRINQ